MSTPTRLAIAAWAATVLGAAVFRPIFEGAYFLPTLAVCTVMTAVAIGVQALRAPRLLVIVAMALAMTEAMAIGYYPDTLAKGVLPWRDTAEAFGMDMSSAIAGMRIYAAPLPSGVEFSVFAVALIGVALIAMYALAVQLRQAAWCGLLLLVMYTVPAATIDGGLSVFVFLPPAIGYLLLLATESKARVANWGRPVSVGADAETTVESSASGAAGRRIAVIVLVLAAALPGLLPSLGEGVIGFGAGAGIGPGDGAAGRSSDPILDMSRNLQQRRGVEALRYTGPRPVMLRLFALQQFTATQWSQSDRGTEPSARDGAFLPPPGFTGDLAGLTQSSYDIRINTDEFRTSWLPLPYPTRSLDGIRGSWRYAPATLDAHSTSGQIAPDNYRVIAYDIDPDPTALRQVAATDPPDPVTLELPNDARMTAIRRLTGQITARATTPYQRALAIQEYFTDPVNGFRYDVAARPNSGIEAINAFLFDDKAGFCVQYASSMALMARIAGIPSRVVVGFLPGSLDGESYVVNFENQHAWPELYFPGTGWVRFEPTPSEQAGIPPTYTDPTSGVEPTEPTPTGTASAEQTPASPVASGMPRQNDPDRNQPVDTGPPATPADPPWGGWAYVRIAGWVSLGLLLAGLPWAFRTLIRRRRYLRANAAQGVELLYAELRDTARDLRLVWPDSLTPRQTGRWLRERLPAADGAAVVRLVHAVELSRYARASTDRPGSGVPGSGAELLAATRQIRDALWHGAGRRPRWRARLAPASWAWYLRRGGSGVRELLDHLDMGLARAGRTVWRRG